MKLAAIRNGQKQTVSANNGFELLQMELELDIGQCGDLTSVKKRKQCENLSVAVTAQIHC